MCQPAGFNGVIVEDIFKKTELDAFFAWANKSILFLVVFTGARVFPYASDDDY